ncbi:MAG TPA: 23S rRNA (adenine(2503)-C(2))-methyltransferase RlmN [candidate division Zixibacteria bacterium]|nr:23S rRNA (adenine(2503)-C(2))-methyltransferase RlmN [candidate division Zixibacteria bacterium]
MTRTDLMGYTSAELEKLMTELGEKPFHGRQLFKWLYKITQPDFETLTDLSKQVRTKLIEQFTYTIPEPEKDLLSEDGTRKFLFRLTDGFAIESVLIPDPESGRVTVCVSSQAGCALNCAFCATAQLGFARNLTVGEIIGQLVYLRHRFGPGAFTNVVFMGMGEPMLNLDRVLAAVGIMTDGAGFSHAAKKVTVSTAGIVPGIEHLAAIRSKVRLAVSLNAPTQEKRVQIMPITKKYPLPVLMNALKKYTQSTGTRVTFEYALFSGFNDTSDDVQSLAHLVRGIPCKINLLAYNPVDGLPFRRPSDSHVEWFAHQLYPRVPAVTVRKSRGVDINAACGQLAGENPSRRN